MAADGVHTILVGVDGSANRAQAVASAAGLASALGAELVAVHALGLLGSTGSQVAQRCTCPVTIVPSAERTADGEA